MNDILVWMAEIPKNGTELFPLRSVDYVVTRAKCRSNSCCKLDITLNLDSHEHKLISCLVWWEIQPGSLILKAVV